MSLTEEATTATDSITIWCREKNTIGKDNNWTKHIESTKGSQMEIPINLVNDSGRNSELARWMTRGELSAHGCSDDSVDQAGLATKV